jgi:NAD(P)-dependent dehydrogenase (short-subunit alcohol dehydrogenase family)
MKEKICIITGFTSGIGKAAAFNLAKMGAALILICRNKDKGEQVINHFKNETGNDKLNLYICELSSQNDIRRVVSEIKTHHPVIDVLINNAGGINEKHFLTEDGFELTFAINHLAYFSLTLFLLDNIKSSNYARIINVASDAHQFSKIDFNYLNMKNKYNPMKVYGITKLANIMFTYELARRLKNTKISVNCMHPGGVNTNFGKNMKGIAGAYFRLSPFSRQPEKGAETIIWLASSPEVEGVSGKYFMDKKEKKSNSFSYDIESQQKLWEESEKMTGVTFTNNV